MEATRAEGDIAQSDEIGGAMLRLRKWMFQRVYLGPEARSEHERVERTLTGLFEYYLENPDAVPGAQAEGDEVQRVTDYIAGMTDRFCIAAFRRLGAAGGVAALGRGCDGALFLGVDRAGAGCGGHRRGARAVYGAEAGGAEASGAVPVP